MVIKHNMNAMNAQRQYGIVADSVSKSTEKLSSGYKINRAADDAAGLAISEKMRKQIRGLDRASVNAEDGISCVQTAEGAMNEVQDMLQRMNELCVQAANGTNSVTDRQYIQDEIDQLISEIDRVSETTKFNEIYLLNGDEKVGIKKEYITSYTTTYIRNTVNYGEYPLPYHVTYEGTNNLYIASNEILSANHSGKPYDASTIRQGDDITQYMEYFVGEPNVANASLDIDKYVAFIGVTLNSDITTGDNGKVNSLLATTSEADRKKFDLSTNGSDSIIRANKDLFIYNVSNDSLTRVNTGSEMTVYLNDNGTMKDEYRLVDILCGKEAEISGIGDMEPHVYYGGPCSSKWEKTTICCVLPPSATNNTLYVGNITEGTDITKWNVDGEYIAQHLDQTYAGTDYTFDDYFSISADGSRFTLNKPIIMYYSESSFYNAVIECNNVGVEMDFDGTSGLQGIVFNVLGQQFASGHNIKNTIEFPGYFLKQLIGNKHPYSQPLGHDYQFVNSILTSAVDWYEKYPAGTSDRVKEEILAGATFYWNDEYIQIKTGKSQLYDADGNEVSAIALNKYFDENGKYTGGLFSSSQATPLDEVKNVGDNSIELYTYQTYREYYDDLELNLHVGAESDRTNKIGIDISSFNVASLGIEMLASQHIGIVDNTGDKATDAIDVVAKALEMVSRERSNLGAIQNRLEHTIKNLDNVVENTTAAESQIRDTDMAEEMVKYSNNNILQQAGQSMLAQANQSNQGVLSLIQ